VTRIRFLPYRVANRHFNVSSPHALSNINRPNRQIWNFSVASYSISNVQFCSRIKTELVPIPRACRLFERLLRDSVTCWIWGESFPCVSSFLSAERHHATFSDRAAFFTWSSESRSTVVQCDGDRQTHGMTVHWVNYRRKTRRHDSMCSMRSVRSMRGGSVTAWKTVPFNTDTRI
jgi:hypothetical protein